MANNHSAEFWRGADWQWVHGATRAHIAEELAAAEAREAFPIPDTLPAVPETREAGEPTAAEVIEELHGCFDTIKHLSADIGTESGDIAVNGVALLGLAKIARWKEAHHGK